MKAILKKAALAAALVTASLSANAAESHITVYTNVDLTLALLKTDGSALPDEIPMVYIPGRGLTPHSERVRIFSNDTDSDVEIRLINAPTLQHTEKTGPGTSVPLTVSLNARPLTVASQDFTAAELYNSAPEGRSVEMDLTFAQTTQAPLTTAGEYRGIVSIALNQKPGTP